MQSRSNLLSLATMGASLTLTLAAGCTRHEAPPPTAQDVDTARQAAQHEVASAREEAAKDIKSAAKVAGPNSRDVALAKATASYDVAMAKADGDHTVATEKCLTLQSSLIQACKDQADADYETAKAAAKATRVARQQ